MPVGEPVVDVSGLAAPVQQSGAMQGLQPRRYGAEFFVFTDQLTNAALAVLKHREETETLQVAHRSEKLGRMAKKHGRRDVRAPV